MRTQYPAKNQPDLPLTRLEETSPANRSHNRKGEGGKSIEGRVKAKQRLDRGPDGGGEVRGGGECIGKESASDRAVRYLRLWAGIAATTTGASCCLVGSKDAIPLTAEYP